MARYKEYDYGQGEFIAVCFEKQIVPGTFEYTLSYLVENEIDLSIFDKHYHNDVTGAKAYDPKIMLKIILFAYSKGIISSRKIEEACHTNILFMALSANTRPDFTTIAMFIRNLKDDILSIFTDILLICSELDLIGGEMFALDGCKFSSNASKEWSGTFPDLRKKKEKLEKTLRLIIDQHKENDLQVTNDNGNKELNNRIKKIRGKKEKIENFLNSNTPKMGTRNRENQSNMTDQESARLMSSHGVVQGYNGLSIADSKHQIVMYADAFGGIGESVYLKDMVEGLKSLFEKLSLGKNYLKNKILIADTGNFSEENLKYLSENKIDAYIPDTEYRKRDSRYAGAGRFKPKTYKYFKHEDFKYIKSEDVYVCPEGNRLVRSVYNKMGNTEGRRYIGKKSFCSICTQKEKCLRTPKTRFRTLFITEKKYDKNYSEMMKAKIDTDKGREIYSHRMGIIEPVFGNLRYCKRLDRFTLRSRKKVSMQWRLFSLVHNIEKILTTGGILKLMQKA